MEKIEKLKKKLSNTYYCLKMCTNVLTNFLPARNCDKTKNKCFTLKILVLVHATKGGILGSPRHSPHLWFIPSVHLEFLAIFVIPSPCSAAWTGILREK